MLLDKAPQLDARMPGFAISETDRQAVDKIAAQFSISRGEIMRRALSLFFAQIANEISSNSNKPRNADEQSPDNQAALDEFFAQLAQVESEVSA